MRWSHELFIINQSVRLQLFFYSSSPTVEPRGSQKPQFSLAFENAAIRVAKEHRLPTCWAELKCSLLTNTTFITTKFVEKYSTGGVRALYNQALRMELFYVPYGTKCLSHQQSVSQSVSRSISQSVSQSVSQLVSK